ncbi:MAG: 1-(5-phosphoribosyl)-5-[(5-phosphoribosylamino)methylideneamino] imidazole-4-carboxamide isomerase [Acidobacteria bacterium]|nr:1-(5-phosphoribosyl)-5-[(5-phosphoribosylamino)methylideneamino] imidazole-4-carboxamide isomerase [Acidobacteriota bacterium]
MENKPSSSTLFEIYPAIDLRQGQVVRLRTGDPGQQTTYPLSSEEAAQRWCEQGAAWLHVVNLDGAFGEAGRANHEAIARIVTAASQYGAQVQLGGGLRSLEALQAVFDLGAARAILGTALVEQPTLLQESLRRWGSERIVAGIDARDGVVQVRGWATGGGVGARALAQQMAEQGLRWMIYTDISRDGTGQGANLAETAALAQQSGLQVIASGGFDRLEEVAEARNLGLAGVILGRALYEEHILLRAALELTKGEGNVGKTSYSLS